MYVTHITSLPDTSQDVACSPRVYHLLLCLAAFNAEFQPHEITQNLELIYTSTYPSQILQISKFDVFLSYLYPSH